MPIADYNRHTQLAIRTLLRVGWLLRNVPYRADDWPYHLVVLGPRKMSVWCGGFDKHLEVATLTKKGGVDHRYKERSFMTPEGAVNYIVRRVKN